MEHFQYLDQIKRQNTDPDGWMDSEIEESEINS
jgi:hypothetical protein